MGFIGRGFKRGGRVVILFPKFSLSFPSDLYSRISFDSHEYIPRGLIHKTALLFPLNMVTFLTYTLTQTPQIAIFKYNWKWMDPAFLRVWIVCRLSLIICSISLFFIWFTWYFAPSSAVCMDFLKQNGHIHISQICFFPIVRKIFLTQYKVLQLHVLSWRELSYLISFIADNR